MSENTGEGVPKPSQEQQAGPDSGQVKPNDAEFALRPNTDGPHAPEHMGSQVGSDTAPLTVESHDPDELEKLRDKSLFEEVDKASKKDANLAAKIKKEREDHDAMIRDAEKAT